MGFADRLLLAQSSEGSVDGCIGDTDAFCEAEDREDFVLIGEDRFSHLKDRPSAHSGMPAGSDASNEDMTGRPDEGA